MVEYALTDMLETLTSPTISVVINLFMSINVVLIEHTYCISTLI
jgi:hypothetical protein